MPKAYANGMILGHPIGKLRLPGNNLEFVLRHDRPLRLSGARGYRLRCLEGCAWLTAPGEPRDIYLLAGDTWQVPCDGLVLIESATETIAFVQLDPAVVSSRGRSG